MKTLNIKHLNINQTHGHIISIRPKLVYWLKRPVRLGQRIEIFSFFINVKYQLGLIGIVKIDQKYQIKLKIKIERTKN